MLQYSRWERRANHGGCHRRDVILKLVMLFTNHGHVFPRDFYTALKDEHFHSVPVQRKCRLRNTNCGPQLHLQSAMTSLVLNMTTALTRIQRNDVTSFESDDSPDRSPAADSLRRNVEMGLKKRNVSAWSAHKALRHPQQTAHICVLSARFCSVGFLGFCSRRRQMRKSRRQAAFFYLFRRLTNGWGTLVRFNRDSPLYTLELLHSQNNESGKRGM